VGYTLVRQEEARWLVEGYTLVRRGGVALAGGGVHAGAPRRLELRGLEEGWRGTRWCAAEEARWLGYDVSVMYVVPGLYEVPRCMSYQGV